MPPDGIPGESREVWVQLLKTINGLADGTMEWRNCFLATARGIGFETSVWELCVLVLRGSQQRYRGIIGVADDDLLVEETKSGSRQFLSWRNVSHLIVGKRERGNSAAETSCKQQMDPCALDSLPISRVWTLSLSEKGGRNNREMQTKLKKLP